LAAGIRRVKDVKRSGVHVGNWLTAEQGKRLLLAVDDTSLRGKRDYATLAILLGCGLRRAELTALRIEDLQQREEHWVMGNNATRFHRASRLVDTDPLTAHLAYFLLADNPFRISPFAF
jgi:integrase